MFNFFFLVALFNLFVSVRGHGYVEEITVGTTKYTGYLPYSDPYYSTPPARIVRKIPGNGPVEDASSIDIQCNGWSEGGVIGSTAAKAYANITAGSTVSTTWTTWPESHAGPVITYLARVPDNADLTCWAPGLEAVWFKIDEAGKTSDGKWAATDILNITNYVYTFTIPPKLKAGQYIVRHEIIALHAAYAYPGAQFYPSCIQIQVSGSGTAFPTEFVSFPGAYTADTPGIIYDMYNNDGVYPIPGPAVWTGGN
ncbi:glycoside hydrolase family 61 protein F [Cyathus striatus]|nr:glycoside hydrolase family 61 protein F [Cyathus striatus]